MRLFEPPKYPLRSALITGLAAAGVFAILVSRAGGVSDRHEIAWLRQLAENGDSGAQLQLGLAYRDGRYGLHPDPRAGLRWLTAAAQAGNPYAADLAGNAYASGQGTPRDPQQALQWWQLAATAGNADAQTHLGEALLAQGKQQQAVTWLRDAADRGDARAHTDLASLYREQGLPDADLHRGDNPVAALSERLDATGLRAIFATWQTLASTTPPVQSGDALVSRAQQGDPLAEYQLGVRYRNGSWAVTRDPQQARVWLQRSAAAGNRLAAHTLAETVHSRTADPTATAPPGVPGISRT